MIYLHKIIPLITSPLFFVLTLLVILIILRKSKLIKLKNSLLLLSILTLFLFSNPLISNKLVKYIESPYHPLKLSEVPVSDYIVVLSGMLHQVKNEVYEWYDPDRFFAGIKLLSLINLDFLNTIEIANKVNVKNKGEVIKGIILCKYIINQNFHLFRIKMEILMIHQIFCISMKQYNLQT